MACTAANSGRPRSSVGLVTFGLVGCSDQWVDERGEPVTEDVVRETSGDSHCGRESVTFVVF